MKEIHTSKESYRHSFTAVSLGDPKASDKWIFGGKAANLSKLTISGLNVPPGYCVGFDAYEYFLTHSKIPQELIEQIYHWKKELGGKIAIRSSASCEDGETLSMAGVFQSEYVNSDEEIVKAIEKIYHSAKNPEVIDYLSIHGISPENVKMGLVIQELIEPNFAGVIYTGLGKKRDRTLIQYVNGLGEKLVDGKDAGQSLVIDSLGGINELGGPKKEEKINVSDISQLVRISKFISKLYGKSNQDIEFAIKGNEIFILQARPLTGRLPDIELQIRLFENGSYSTILAEGPEINGIVVNIEEFKNREQAYALVKKLLQANKKIVLVAKELDLTHDSLISISSGLIVESAGIVSHGAQRARELNIGALSGIPITQLRSGSEVIFKPNLGIVTMVENKGTHTVLGIHQHKQEANINTTLLRKHLENSQQFVIPQDPGIDGAMYWLERQLKTSLPSNLANALLEIVIQNKPDPSVSYTETGYDSCQSNRKVAKVAAEAILLGGVIYETQLLGLKINLEEAKSLVNSSLDVDRKHSKSLLSLSQDYGEQQHFIFPGVTPSSADTPSLEHFANMALMGKPLTSVRTLTGVGGLRLDRDWNHATDLQTFLELKITEDKRYYPGIIIAHLLGSMNLDEIPLIGNIRQSHPDIYKNLLSLSDSLKKVEKLDFEGVSVLCSGYLPHWDEISEIMKYAIHDRLELAQAFHTPSYELGALKHLFQNLVNNQYHDYKTINETLQRMLKAMQSVWSFNSTIHLPWADGKATLANGLIGKITTEFGDHSIRYGVGYDGKSLEIVEHHYGARRNPNNSSAVVYQAKYYSQSDLFEGSPATVCLNREQPLWKQIEKQGFMKTALTILSSKNDNDIFL